MTPYGLQTEQRTEPLGLGEARPRLSWKLGSVGDWLFGQVAGIGRTAGSVAYRALLPRPRPGGNLTWARAEQETARGTVACGWSLADGQITVIGTVPPGCTALLEMPTPGPAIRLTSGRFTYTAAFFPTEVNS
jgi:alpha-L-rhamnosidase